MKLLLAHLGCYLLSVYAASITPFGVSPDFVPPRGPSPRTPTDFEAMFDTILGNRAASSSSTSAVQRVSRDDTIQDPKFFSLGFGPTNGATSADGFMGFVSFDDYDVDGCAQECNGRAFDDTSGPCIFFNIWTAVVNGTATTTMCSLYNTVTDISTATNTGQGSLQVSESRGYSRISLIQDGSFQDYTCILGQGKACPALPSAFWTRVFNVSYDFFLVNNFPGHSGTSACNIFFFAGEETATTPDVPSTLTYTPALNAVAGQLYILSFFFSQNFQNQTTSAEDALFSVFWNGVNVLDVVEPAGAPVSGDVTYFNGQVQVLATGNDTLFFKNGPASPHQLFLDDIALFENWF